ncbi:VOC family protein [Lichenihabitans psoromatis]|uniref:VOC family protein n=1 Tax=Lichenihabitans psoromatis TaxID=2528642 RepID=UPI0010385A09|nr:VOC family protein [Lichenihabitans psoromatis]
MATGQGQFCWYELMTTDAAAASHFYCAVIGWTAETAGPPGLDYKRLLMDGAPICGLMRLPESLRAPGWRPSWIGHVAIDDVDAMVVRVRDAAGAIHREPTDIPGVGRFAVVADPQGAAFVLFQGLAEIPSVSPAPEALGSVGWRELYATDWQAAFAFYEGLFGWTKGDAIDMGPMGTYQLFCTGAQPVGGLMNKVGSMPVPFWSFYFTVDDIKSATARVVAHGGTILRGPNEVPGGSWIVNCFDPQGAMFCLTAPR